MTAMNVTPSASIVVSQESQETPWGNAAIQNDNRKRRECGVASTTKRKKVRFGSAHIRVATASGTTDDRWLTRSEHREMQQQAKNDVRNFQAYSPEVHQAILDTFQECSREHQSMRKLLSNPATQRVVFSDYSAKGLECRSHSVMRKYRTFHVQSILAVQEKIRSLTPGIPNVFV